MRDLPDLSADVLARASRLSAKVREARRVAPTATPKAMALPVKVDDDGVATIRLYDIIDREGGEWGISAEEFATALDEVPDASEIVLRINSGGGSVWDGLTILNNLRDHPARVTAIVDGLAASAASFIAVAADETVMMPNSRLMIHDTLGICIGQAIDMREYADFLDDSSDNIAEIYAARAGGTKEEWRDRMVAKGLLGQWYSAQDAVEAGLVDRVEAPEPSQAVEQDAPAARAETPKPPASRASYWERRHSMNKQRIDAA